MRAQGALLRGRQAFDRHAWARAFRMLAKADRAGRLEPVDLERLATAAYMLDRADDHLDYQKRAHHEYFNAGESLRAARCAFWVGAGLATRGEASQAAGWFARAQRLVEREHRDSVERGYVLIPPLLQRIGRGDWAGAATLAAKVQRLAERFRDRDLFALAAHERGHALVRVGRAEQGLLLIDEVMVSVTAGELSPVVTGLVYCSVIAYCQDLFQFGRAQAWTQALTRWCEGQPEMVAHAGQCRVHRAEILQVRGGWRLALAEARRAAVCLADARNRAATGHALYQQAEIHRLQGKFGLAERAYRDATRHGWEPQPGFALLRLAQGETAAAAGAIRRALAEPADAWKRARLLPAAVEILLASGDLAQAVAACDQLASCAKQRASGLLDAVVDEWRGAVLLAQGDARAAVAALRRAFEAWQALEAPYESARLRVLVARACRALGDHESATLEFEAARDAFARLGARPDLDRVDVLAQAAGSAAERRLTAREVEVLRHVAAGKSNKAIAKGLALSERTVDRHLSNIFDKLGVSSRTAAAAYAYRSQLV